MPLVFAKKFVSAASSAPSVKEMIHSALAGWEPPRNDRIIHASELFRPEEFCPREKAFYIRLLAKPKASYVGTSLRLTYDYGRHVEYQLRNVWLRDKAVGEWKCSVCKTPWGKFGKAPKVKCPNCGRGAWEYVEVQVTDPETGVSGSIDVLLDMGGMTSHVVEIKTMDKDEIKTLVAPKAEHRARTSLYLLLLSRSKDPRISRVDSNCSTILYQSKSFGFKDTTLKAHGVSDSPFSPFREFSVSRGSLANYVPQLSKAKALTAWMQDGMPVEAMPYGVCPTSQHPRAKKCGACAKCFSGSYPGLYAWAGAVIHGGATPKIIRLEGVKND